MAHSFSSQAFLVDFNTASVADYPVVTYSFVFSAMAFPILYRTENFLTEQTVFIRLKCSVVDCFRFKTSPCEFLIMESVEARLIEILEKPFLSFFASFLNIMI
jgi:hypothetical protein